MGSSLLLAQRAKGCMAVASPCSYSKDGACFCCSRAGVSMLLLTSVKISELACPTGRALYGPPCSAVHLPLGGQLPGWQRGPQAVLETPVGCNALEPSHVVSRGWQGACSLPTCRAALPTSWEQPAYWRAVPLAPLGAVWGTDPMSSLKSLASGCWALSPLEVSPFTSSPQ